MQKKYVVRLSSPEREHLAGLVRKFSGSSQKVRRAQMLLKADVDGPGWTDRQIADAFGCRTRTAENVRRHLVERGLDQTLDGIRRSTPPTPRRLDGEQEAKVIATRLGPPPPGYATWTLRLLARRVVELSIVASISHETVRRTLKKVA
jgi:transposase